MTHETITVDMVHSFEWYDDRRAAAQRAKELERNGVAVYIGGKRAKSRATYHDIKIAAIYQNKWSGDGSPWVVAW